MITSLKEEKNEHGKIGHFIKLKMNRVYLYNSWAKPGLVACTSNPYSETRETGGFLELGGHLDNLTKNKL